jgi:hypothetical protein
MSLWSWVRARLRAGGPASVPAGAGEARSGGPEDTGTFVGRIAGDDPGYLETGAEKRAAGPDDEPGGASG